MNARAIISDVPLGPGDPRANLLYARLLLLRLADHVYGLRDAGDFREFLLVAAEEARKIAQIPDTTEVSLRLECGTGTKTMPPPPQRRYRDHTCPDCDHEHEGREECAKYLGEGRFCHCPSKVAA